MSKRIALGVEYNGQNYHGWQRQVDEIRSVQACLEEAVSKVSNHPVHLTCAGRTDKGVHATAQVVHFDTKASRPLKAWVFGTSSLSPPDIGVKWSVKVPGDFDARFSALSRRYVYLIYNSCTPPALHHGRVAHEPRTLDADKMHQAAQALLGENDFTSFRAANCQSNTPFRNVHHLRVARKGDLIHIDIKANAFLYHMVRNIAGVLMDIGAGVHAERWTGDLLRAKDRTLASVTASPQGLYLVDVEYPDVFAIPKGAESPSILANPI